MGFQPSEGFSLSLHDYGAVVWTLNKRQNPGPTVAPPDEVDVETHMAQLEKLGLVRTLH